MPFTPSLPADIGAQLAALAHEVATACPDMRQRARDLAQALLARYKLGNLDPDKVYWHRFSDQVSSSRAFSGWAHYRPPLQSHTLVELVMVRFSAADSEAPDVLDAQSGFYTADAQADVYDERNEIRLLPSKVLTLFWATDFKARFADECQRFWAQHTASYRVLAKATALGQALAARQHGRLSDQDLGQILNALAGPVQAPATRAMLEAHHAPTGQVRVGFLRIGQHQATDVLHIIDAPRHYLYLPGEVDPWLAFDDAPGLHWGLLQLNRDPEQRARFASHFPLRSALAEHGRQPLNETIDLLFSTWGQARAPLLEPPSSALETDVFSLLTDRVRARMEDDAQLRLTSNATLRECLWLSYLGAFDKVFGPLGALDWPVTLACIGAGLAEVALNLDQALTAPTTAHRQQAVIGAAVASVGLLLNAAFFWGAWERSFPVELPPPPPRAVHGEISLAHMAPERVFPETELELMQDFSTNRILSGPPPASAGPFQGIHILDGRFYIELGGHAYQVRQAQALGGWVIVDPANPYAFQRNVPVRLTPEGKWELVPRPGLLGGGQALGCLDASPRASYTPAPACGYELPLADRPVLREAALDARSSVLDGEDYAFIDNPHGNAALENFRELRLRLQRDAKRFFKERPVTPAPTAPLLPPARNARELLTSLYGPGDGLLLGEVHQHEAARAFLIRHMRVLRKLGVDTLYMEHLLADFHAQELAVALEQRQLPEALKRYLGQLDAGSWRGTPSRASFLAVVQTASEQGMRVVPLDCLASYRIGGLEDPADTLRQQMMNYYAHRVIRADQALRPAGSKWIALVGNTHASAYRTVQGLDTLEGATSVRFEDIPPGGGEGLSLDPGCFVRGERGLPGLTLRSHYLYRSEAVAMAPLAATSELTHRLSRVQSFLLARTDDQWTLLLRHADGRLTITPVLKDQELFLVNLPELRQVHHLRYTSLDALSNDLKRLGFMAVSWSS